MFSLCTIKKTLKLYTAWYKMHLVTDENYIFKNGIKNVYLSSQSTLPEVEMFKIEIASLEHVVSMQLKFLPYVLFLQNLLALQKRE